jgi:hypothetical protein
VSVLLNGGAPLPVPGFDEYVALGYAATWLLEQSPEFRNLYRRTTMLGLDALGNMLYLRRRKVAFAPDTPLVRELVQHLNESHAFFGTHFGGIYDTEDAAVSALNVGRREGLWGIVAVRDDGDGTTRGCAGGAAGGPHCVSYAIHHRPRHFPPVRLVQPTVADVLAVLHVRVPHLAAYRGQRVASHGGRGPARGDYDVSQ